MSRIIHVNVPGVGDFTFRRRTLGDDITIMARYDRMLGGITQPSPLLDSLATAVATYGTLALSWPKGWEPEKIVEMDVLAEDRTADLLRVFGALSAREDEFRPPEKRRFQAPREGNGEHARSVVPPEIQPAAD